MRVSLVLLIVTTIAGASPAVADTDLVVLGPAAIGTVADARLREIRGAIDRAVKSPPVARAIDATCASDPVCLVKAGTELEARRVLSVAVAEPSPDRVLITLALVDVIGKELVATRDLDVGTKRIAKELGPSIVKFVDEASTDRAKFLFAEGDQHFNLGEFGPALELYKRAYRIKPLPAFLFNMAQCDRKLGHHQDAIAMYQSYLVGVPNAPNQAMVESLIAESRAALAEEQQRERERAALEAARLETERKRAEEGRKGKEAEAVTAIERRKAEQARIERDRELYDRHPARRWSIVTGSLGVVATVTGGFFGVKARSAQTSFDAAGCGDRAQLLGAAEIASCQSTRDRGQRDATFSNAFLIGGGITVLASAVVFALDPGNVERPEPRAHVALSPSSIQVVLAW